MRELLGPYVTDGIAPSDCASGGSDDRDVRGAGRHLRACVTSSIALLDHASRESYGHDCEHGYLSSWPCRVRVCPYLSPSLCLTILETHLHALSPPLAILNSSVWLSLRGLSWVGFFLLLLEQLSHNLRMIRSLLSTPSPAPSSSAGKGERAVSAWQDTIW